MRRKGGRVVSSTKEVILLDAEPSNVLRREEVVAGGIESIPPVGSSSPLLSSSPSSSRRPSPKRGAGKGKTTTAVSSLDIFSRFQNHNSDFEEKWLLLEDDLPLDSGKPPISEELLGKLKQSQRRIDFTRNTRTEELNKKESAASLENNKEDISDEEYHPETPKVSKQRQKHNEGGAKGPSEDANLSSNKLGSKGDDTAMESGIRGDYLVFSTSSTQKGAGGIGMIAGLTVDQLQASVLIYPSEDNPTNQIHDNTNTTTTTTNNNIVHNNGPGSSRGFPDRGTMSPKGKNSRNAQSPSSLSSVQSGKDCMQSPPSRRMVPLWSVSRMEKEGGYCQESPLVALHQEITDLVDYLCPTQAEISIRRLIEMEVSQLARRLWPGCEPIVYGSLYTNLLLPLSDVDITITNVPIPPEEALTLLAREISQAGLCDAAYPQLILKTKVPLVKFQHKGSLVDVDISINAGDGKQNSDIVHTLLKSFPEARALIIVVKYFLQQRDMAEPYRGGLGSYATTLLVVAFLQSHPIYTTRPDERAVSGLGRLLVDFFRFYGLYWNYHHCGVSVEAGRGFFSREGGEGSPTSPRSPFPPSPPSASFSAQAWIEDPGNLANNAASSLRLYHVVASLFTHAYSALTAGMGAGEKGAAELSPATADLARRPTLLSRILHVDAGMVGRRGRLAEAAADLSERGLLPARSAKRSRDD
ncbi:unnamed protein product [Phytomonas sp. Hart1]|nr:unnamed protein product [Phytomonas sp. Hart1]|eukprot:CCW71656.1 unnamed protein product [Phytomonas sp. isolate Hart1]